MSGTARPRYPSGDTAHFFARSTPFRPTIGKAGLKDVSKPGLKMLRSSYYLHSGQQGLPVALMMVSISLLTPFLPTIEFSVISTTSVKCTSTFSCWIASMYGSPGVIRLEQWFSEISWYHLQNLELTGNQHSTWASYHQLVSHLWWSGRSFSCTVLLFPAASQSLWCTFPSPNWSCLPSFWHVQLA